MSKHISTIKGASYVVTPTVGGTITMTDGTVITSYEAGQQASFTAPADVAIVSDDSATIIRAFRLASPSAQGGGDALAVELLKHIQDDERHLTADERAWLEAYLPGFAEPDPPVPAGALPHAAIRAHFARYAQPGVEEAPNAVYVSRVPLAYQNESGTWFNTGTEVDETATGLSRKLFDNAGLVNEQSTDTVIGQNDYAGKWAFYWQHANYVTDEFGVKHISDIKGVHSSFDPCAKNVCAFGPAFWFFCKAEKSVDEDGVWRTHDGTESGHPLFQVYGITSHPWSELTAEAREQLASIGVAEEDLTLWPECRVWDAEAGELVARSYWCHSAYCGGAELQEDGSYKLVSKRNLPQFNQISYASLHALYGNAAGFGGSAVVQAFGILMDIVKVANKNSQLIHRGMSDNYRDSVQASHSTVEAGYVFPVASQGFFGVGCTVQLQQEAGDRKSITHRLSKAVQQARIVAIEPRELAQQDGSVVSSLCLVLDPATCQPFKVCTTSEAAAALSAAGEYAHVHAIQGAALTGETDAVPYPHDGSMTSYTDGNHPYRVQGTTYLAGFWHVSADVVAIRGTGVESVEVDGVVSTLGADEYIILKAAFRTPCKTSGTLADYLAAGYVAVGIAPCGSNWILNICISKHGIAYPTAVGGSDSKGCGDCFYYSESPAAYLVGGGAHNTSAGGSAGVSCIRSFMGSDVSIGARD